MHISQRPTNRVDMSIPLTEIIWKKRTNTRNQGAINALGCIRLRWIYSHVYVTNTQGRWPSIKVFAFELDAIVTKNAWRNAISQKDLILEKFLYGCSSELFKRTQPMEFWKMVQDYKKAYVFIFHARIRAEDVDV